MARRGLSSSQRSSAPGSWLLAPGSRLPAPRGSLLPTPIARCGERKRALNSAADAAWFLWGGGVWCRFRQLFPRWGWTGRGVCRTVSYRTVLYCIVLYCIVSYRTEPCRTVPNHTVPYRIVSYRIASIGTVPHCSVLVLYRIVSYRVYRYCTILYCIVPYCTVSYHIVSYRTVPYHTVPYLVTRRRAGRVSGIRGLILNAPARREVG